MSGLPWLILHTVLVRPDEKRRHADPGCLLNGDDGGCGHGFDVVTGRSCGEPGSAPETPTAAMNAGIRVTRLRA